MIKIIRLSCLLAGLFIQPIFAQNTSSNLWSSQDLNHRDQQELRLPVGEYELYQLDMSALKTVLSDCLQRKAISSKADYVEVDIPLLGEGLSRFGLFETPIMEAGIQAKYPQIRTYTGQGLDDPRQIIKLDVGPNGFHAMVFSNKKTYLIEPAFKNDLSQYMVFAKNDALLQKEKEPFSCMVSGEDGSLISSDSEFAFRDPTGEQLRTYRLALATTGEYSIFHGGTKPLVLAAMVTVMNRVNGIYENDLTVTMVLINNTDTLIYFDPDMDPYTNNSGGTMLGENNTTIDAIIGDDNYDIGHVFSTGGGGIAGLGVVCADNKASGVTGLGSPIGDAFSVDYVAHEIGHQFSGNHTFSSCGGQGPRPYEPGSGVTVMAYAGICDDTDIADHSIPQFHVASYDEIISFSQLGNGNTCAAITETGNTAPTVDVGVGGFYIPFQTPFELTGTATDLEGDSLTYCWEQFDIGPNTHPDIAEGSAPLFRSWLPENHGTRIFPIITDLVDNTHTIGELLPQFGRELNFRMTVRDNVAGGGGVDYDHLTFQVADDSGPFEVMSPDGSEKWQVGYLEAVSWSVAKTDLSPVNCSEVDIWLSDNGGYTYPHLVASNVPNNGHAVIKVPDMTGNAIRVKVKASDNVFFDISNQNFSIDTSARPDFSFAASTSTQTICGGDTATYEILLDSVLGFNNPVNLSVLNNPNGTAFSFSSNDIVPPGTVSFSISNSGGATPGDYNVTVLVTSDTVTKELPLTLKIRNGAPGATSLLTPFSGARGVSRSTALRWNNLPLADSYTIEIALNADFTNVVYSESGIESRSFDPEPNLNNNTIYFWRVRASDASCGDGQWSAVRTFQTTLSECSEFNNGAEAVQIPSPGTLVSELNVTQDFIVEDVNVVELIGDHRRVGHLLFTLIDPAGNRAVLIDRICGNDNDFFIGLDDEGLATSIPCPPVNGLFYQPVDNLSRFDGNPAAGTWTLEIQDSVNQTRGELQRWTLELCGPTPNTEQPNLVLEPGKVNIGDTLIIGSDHLTADCSDSSADLNYTIMVLPTNGQLFVNGNPIVVGSEFSQNDIDNNLLTYVNDGEDLDPDNFEFIITCPNGPYLGGLAFGITVEMMSNTRDLNDVSFSIYPNPANQSIGIKLTEEFHPYEMKVIDMLGRTSLQLSLLSSYTHVDINSLSTGVYLCQILLNDAVVGEQKIMIMR